jgi:hypothetical protein
MDTNKSNWSPTPPRQMRACSGRAFRKKKERKGRQGGGGAPKRLFRRSFPEPCGTALALQKKAMKGLQRQAFTLQYPCCCCCWCLCCCCCCCCCWCCWCCWCFCFCCCCCSCWLCCCWLCCWPWLMTWAPGWLLGLQLVGSQMRPWARELTTNPAGTCCCWKLRPGQSNHKDTHATVITAKGAKQHKK